MSKIPEFKSIEEEANFWDTHDSTDFLDDMQEVKEKIFFSPRLKKKLYHRRKTIKKKVYQTRPGRQAPKPKI